MRASCGHNPLPAAVPAILAVASLLGSPPRLAWPQSPASTAVALEPAFRLPAGGRSLAGPIVDSGDPASAWFLSEDNALYVITEGGELRSRIAFSGKVSPYLALDPFERGLCLVRGRLDAATKSGTIAYSLKLPRPPAAPPAFGSDGRAFIALGAELACYSPAGRLLWSRSLPGTISSPPAVDASGRPALGLEDGSIVVFSPYGELEFSARSGSGAASRVSLIAPLANASAPGSELPCLAAALDDGRLLLVYDPAASEAAAVPILAPGGEPIVDLFWDGALLYALDAAGGLSALSARGSLVWSLETRCREGRVAVFEERIVVEGKGRAVSLSLEGTLFREMVIANSAGRAAVAPGGLLFAPGEDWILAAYRFEAPLGGRRAFAPEPYADLESAAEALAAEIILYDPLARDADRHNRRLDDIEKRLRSGTIGKDEPEDAAFCAILALGIFDRGYPQAERRFRSNPLPRARACAMLGELGSPGYRGVLARVLAEDEDVAVRATACDALAAIGVDPDGVSAAAFLAAARSVAEERTALGLIAAIERMALRSGTAPGQGAVETLLALAGKPYSSSVRGRASDALGRIAGTIGDR